MFSQTYAAAVVVVLSQVLPLFGINVGSEALTTTIATILTVVGGLWVIVRRLQNGDIDAFGRRK
jgi:uncharacterized membrane protein